MGESSNGHRIALCLPEHQLMDFLFVFAVQLSALGSEVYRNEENLQELPRVVTCLIPRSSPCSMNKVRGTLGNQPFRLLYGNMIFRRYVVSFHGVRRFLVLSEAFQRLESCVTAVSSVYRHVHRS